MRKLNEVLVLYICSMILMPKRNKIDGLRELAVFRKREYRQIMLLPCER